MMKRLKEDIANRTFHSVYLLYGEEDYLKTLYRDRLKKAVLEEDDEMNLSVFSGKDLDMLQFSQMLQTMPFFSDYRLVLVEDSGLFKSASDLVDLLENKPDSSIVVFVEKEVDKRGKAYKYVHKMGLDVEMKYMSEHELEVWVAGMLQKNGRVIRQNTMQYMLSQMDNSMVHITQELEKVIAYTAGREEVTREDVDAVCCVQITGKIFQMMDAIASGRRKETMQLYHDLLILRESPMSILYLLTRHFQVLLILKQMGRASRDEMIRAAGVPPFALGRYQAQCRNFTLEDIRHMLDACVETEYQFKRGNLSDRMGVEILIVSFLDHLKK